MYCIKIKSSALEIKLETFENPVRLMISYTSVLFVKILKI